MTYKEESYVLDTLDELQEKIRAMPNLKQMAKEVHENNIMLRQIIKYLNRENLYANQENENDFVRNVIANLISSGFDFNKLFRK